MLVPRPFLFPPSVLNYPPSAKGRSPFRVSAFQRFSFFFSPPASAISHKPKSLSPFGLLSVGFPAQPHAPVVSTPFLATSYPLFANAPQES